MHVILTRPPRRKRRQWRPGADDRGPRGGAEALRGQVGVGGGVAGIRVYVCWDVLWVRAKHAFSMIL